jgi:hypothetical protein
LPASFADEPSWAYRAIRSSRCIEGGRAGLSANLAAAEAFKAPPVKRLSIRALVASIYERFMPDTTHIRR